MLFRILSGLRYSLFPSWDLVSICCGISKDPMRCGLSTQFTPSSVCLPCDGARCNMATPSCTVSWDRNLCTHQGLWPEGFCTWWVFCTIARLILIHQLPKELRAQAILVTLSIPFWKAAHNLLGGLALFNSPGKSTSRTPSPGTFNPTFRGTLWRSCHINLRVFFTMLSLSLGYSRTYPVLWLEQNSVLSSAVCAYRGSKKDMHIRPLCPIQGTNTWKLTLSTFLP